MGVFQKYDLQLAPSSWQLVCNHLTSGDMTEQQNSISEDRLHVSSFVQPLPDFLICKMCDDVFVEPQLTDCCQHSYCKSCITMVTSKICPECRNKFEQLTTDLTSSRIISDQEIKCPYHLHKCPWTGYAEDIKGHLLTCQHRPMDCPNGCGKRYEKRNMLYHINLECPLGVVKCQDCSQLVKLSDYSTHLTGVSSTTVCPNGCTKPVSMERLQDHVMNCPLRKVTCKFSDCGCTVSVGMSEMDKHLNDSVHYHLTLVYDDLMLFKQRTKQLEQQLMEERQARTFLEKNISEMNVKLNKLFTS